MRIEEVLNGIGQQENVENHRVALLVGQEGERAKQGSVKLEEPISDVPVGLLDEVGQEVGFKLPQQRQPGDSP